MSSDAKISTDHAANWPMYFTGIAALSLCAFDIPIHGPTSLFFLVVFTAMHAIPFGLIFADVFWFYRFVAAWILFIGLFPLFVHEEGTIFIGLVILFLIVVYRTLLLAGFEIYQLAPPTLSPEDADQRKSRRQFTVTDLFLVTIVVGMSAGLVRLGVIAWPIGSNELFSSWTPFTSLIAVLGNLFLLHTMLHVRFVPWRMFAGALFAVPWLGSLIGTIDYWKVISFTLGYTTCLFFFAILRANGYRWAWNGL